MIGIASEQVHAQIYSDKQVTISENLQNDPVAQEILKKIEQSKKQITEFEQKIEKQNEIEQKRTESLAILQKDLEQWENLWQEFTFDYMFEKQSGIFWDQYNFTKSKIMAGRAALQDALSNGTNAEEARAAYVDAAKIKRSEIIEANSLFNVKHGLAYYNQQILFDADGQFHDIVSGDQLRKYYQDFRTNPAYLKSNPNDESSWTDLTKGIQSECREGYTLIHRFQTDDYVCVTEQTAEMWSRHNMGKPMTEYVIQPSDENLTAEKFREDTINAKISNISNKIETTYKYYEKKMQDLDKKYELEFDELKAQQIEEEQNTITESEKFGMSQEDILQRIEDIREVYNSLEHILLEEKEQTFEIMETNHKQHMKEFVSNFESMSDVKVLWNSEELRYEVARA